MKKSLKTITVIATLFVSQAAIKAQTGAVYEAANNQFKITTNFGNLIMGQASTVDYGWMMMKTTSSMFCFDKTITTATGIFGSYNTTNLVFQTNSNPGTGIGKNATRMTILNSNGYVGIGTSTPEKLFTVKSSIANTQIAKFADDTRYIGLGKDEIAAFDLTGAPANLYLGGSGKISILTNGNVGIGTTAPSERLQLGDRFVFHDGGNKYIGYNSHFDGTNNVRLANDYASSISFGGGDINFQTDINSTTGSIINGTTRFVIKNTGEIGIGTNAPNKKLTVVGDVGIISSAVNALEISSASTNIVNFKVTNTGIVYAREVNVQLGTFPDYVFAKNYKLTPLLEVEKYINTNHHLKGFEPANQYETNGMAVGEVVRLQQEKIEELTLYLIEQQKQLAELKKQMDSLKK
jgi:hypothetical protein